MADNEETTMDLIPMPMRANPAPLNSRDLHPRWSDGTPVLLGQDVEHATERWQGFVAGIPSSEEVTVCWWMSDDEDYSDGEECSPSDLWRR